MSTAYEEILKKKNGLVKVLYVISIVLAVIFVYMAIVNVKYITGYMATYGMMFSDMWSDVLQYVITGSVSYLVYAILVFSAGKIISLLPAGKEKNEDSGDDAALNENSEQEKAPVMVEETKQPSTDLIKQRKKRRTIK